MAGLWLRATAPNSGHKTVKTTSTKRKSTATWNTSKTNLPNMKKPWQKTMEIKRKSKEIAKQEQRRKGYKKLEQQLKESGETQISTSDPDSRHQITRNNITEVSYSHKPSWMKKTTSQLIITTNANDKKAMGNYVARGKSIYGTTTSPRYGKGYLLIGITGHCRCA